MLLYWYTGLRTIPVPRRQIDLAPRLQDFDEELHWSPVHSAFATSWDAVLPAMTTLFYLACSC